MYLTRNRDRSSAWNHRKGKPQPHEIEVSHTTETRGHSITASASNVMYTHKCTYTSCSWRSPAEQGENIYGLIMYARNCSVLVGKKCSSVLQKELNFVEPVHLPFQFFEVKTEHERHRRWQKIKSKMNPIFGK
jgi:hypothetical protein